MKRQIQSSLAILLILVLSSSIHSEITGTIGDGMYFSDEDSEKIKSMGFDTVETIENINKFAQLNFQLDSNAQRALVKIDETTWLITIEAPPGKLFAEIPKGINADYIQGKLVFTGSSERILITPGSETIDTRTGKLTKIDPLYDRPFLEVNGFIIDSEKRFKAEFTEEKGIKVLKLIEGEAIIKAGDTGFDGISEAVLKLQDAQIIYAEFISPKGGNYNIPYKERLFQFRVKEKGRVVFDPENNIIKGENADLKYFEERAYKSFEISSLKPFTITLENGAPFKIELEQGASFFSSGTFTSKGKLTIFLNGENIENFQGNAVSFGDKIKIKGFVKYEREGTTLTYEGLSENAYTEFDELETNFNVKKGKARIDNNRHEILVENGKAKLRVKNGAEKYPTSFSFLSYDENGKLNGYLDEREGTYTITSYNADGELKTISIPFSEFDRTFSRTAFELLNEFQSKEEQIAVLEKRLQEINEQLDKNPIEKEQWELQKIIAQKSLSRLKGESSDSSIDRLREFIQTAKTPELNSNAQLMLAESLLEKANSQSPPIKYTLTKLNQEDLPDIINFEVIDGKVTAILQGEKRLPLTLAPEIIKEELRPVPPEFRDIIDRLSENNELSVLQEATKGLILSNEGFNKDSSHYQTLDEQYKEARKLLNEVRSYAIKIDNKKLEQTMELMIAGSYASLEGAKKVEQELGKIINSYNYDSEIRAEAQRLLSLTLFQKAPRENAQKTLLYLGESVRESKNEQAAKQLQQIKLGLIDERIDLYAQEPYKVLDNVLGILERTDGIFHPVSRMYYQFSGRTEELAKNQQLLLDENNLGIAGVQTARSLIANNIELEKFMLSSYEEKFKTIMEIQGLDTISVEDFEKYAGKSRFSFTGVGTDYSERVKELIQVVKEETNSEIADEFYRDFNKAAYLLGALEHSVENDPALYLIATNGKVSGADIFYEGNLNLATAFTTDRAGKSIEKTSGETFVLSGVDFGASLLALGGVGKIGQLASGLPYVGKTVSGIRAVLTPAETLALKTLGEQAPKTAVGLGLVGEFGTQTAIGEVLSLIDPRLQGAYDIVSALGGASRESIKGLSVIVNGDTKLFVKAESQEAVDRLSIELRKQGLRDIEVGTQIPKGFKEVASGTIDDLIQGESFRLRSQQEDIAQLFQRTIDLPESEIARINRGEFTESERLRIERAKRLLRENGFDNELKLLDTKEAQQELLFSHYSGNEHIIEGLITSPIPKFRELRRIGFSRESLRMLGDEGVLGIEITSSIGYNPKLIRLSEEAGRNQKVQRDLDHLFNELKKGNINAGIGFKPLEGTDIIYMRGKNGGRLFVREIKIRDPKTRKVEIGGYEIVGKSSKDNEGDVINELKKIYSR